MTARRYLLSGLFAVLIAAIATHALAQSQGGQAPPTAVTVVTLSAQDVTLTATLPGRVVASGVAEVRPQVDGIIEERLFDEGSTVAMGDPLYRIDAASYEAKVAAAKAQVTQARAQLEASKKEAERVEELIGTGFSTAQNLEAAVAQRDADTAALEVALAGVQAAEIDLDRTTIRARLSGVIGRSLTTRGALVTAGQTSPLAVIRALDPVLVDVTQSAAELLAWRRGSAREWLSAADTTVSLILADGETYEHTGEMTAAEPYVDELTGVVTLRMEFANPDHLLLPGMYVQVVMPQGVAKDVILAPQQGVTRDRRGNPVALVVNADNVVEQRELEIAQARGAYWVVTKGLADGDRLVVEGLQKTGPGATVAPEEQAPAGGGEAAEAATAPAAAE